MEFVSAGARKSVHVFIVLLGLLVLHGSAHAEIYMSISGNVKDADTGAGISEARVIAVTGSNAEKSYSATTDNNGNFVVKYVPSGAYNLHVDSPSTYVVSNKPYKLTVEKGMNVVGVDIRLEKGGSISGRVFQSDGVTPARAASIVAYTSEDNIDFAETNDTGEYIITRLRKTETCKVLILPDGFAGVVMGNISVLPGQGTKNVDFVLKPDMTTGITGTITDQTGHGIANAKVFVSGDKGSGKAATDNSGRFSVLGLAAGTYYVSVMRDGYKSLVKAGVQVVTGQLVTVAFSLSRLDLVSSGSVKTKEFSDKETPDQIINTLSESHKIVGETLSLTASRGCGPFGMNIPDEYGFKACCEVHDGCYDQCLPKGNCDVTFCSCLIEQCNSYNPGYGQHQKSACYSDACSYCGAVTIGGHFAWFPACIGTLIKGDSTQ